MTRSPEITLVEHGSRDLLKQILRKIRLIVKENHHISKLSIRPIGHGSSRLSIPIKMSGTDPSGKRVHLFGKILGSSDFVSALSIQFIKNIYLHMNAQDPIFEASTSAEEMARYQYEQMRSIYKIGVPTAKPIGYHQIDEIRWLLVVEYIEGKPLASTQVSKDIMYRAFKHMKRMHTKRIFHGDIKPDNIMIGEKVFILDVGKFRKDVPVAKKEAYDVACMIGSFLQNYSPEEVLETARMFYAPRFLKAAVEYLELVQRRPDIYFTDETAGKLKRLMKK